MNKRALGTFYEKAAGAYLERQGYEIVEYNFRCRQGEIDIVAREGGYLVFVEVKYRRGTVSGSPFEAVDYRKQRMISRTASRYCYVHGYGENTPCRFDVVAVLGEDMKLVRNAFDYCG
jgi:putative endonuclease